MIAAVTRGLRAVTVHVCVAVGSTPATFDSPESKAAATPTPVRAEKEGANGLPAANDEQPTHNPEPNTAAGEF